MFKIFNNLTTLQKSLAVSICSILFFILSSGVSYSFFSGSSISKSTRDLASSIPGLGAIVTEDPSEPRTEICPLNGDIFTKKASENWQKRIPLAVMVENHSEARPQSGLSSAQIIYEAVAEGGITRFMAIYLCELPDIQVGPVRSARTYFLDWLSEYDALYAHVGGANCHRETGSGCANGAPADALGQIVKYKIRDLDQRGISFPTFWRDYQRLGRSVATEHTMYSSTDKLWAEGTKRKWMVETETATKWAKSFVPWIFKDAAPAGTAATATEIKVDFWQSDNDFSVTWKYDGECNCYKRFNGGEAHMDLNNNTQLSPKTVVIQYQTESRANDGYEGNVRLVYKNIGQGDALVFQDGNVIEGKWVKKTRIDRTKFVDKNGKEIALNRGMIWIQTVPDVNKVSY